MRVHPRTEARFSALYDSMTTRERCALFEEARCAAVYSAPTWDWLAKNCPDISAQLRQALRRRETR